MPDATGDDLLKSLGRNVREARLRLGVTLDELAALSDIDVLTLEMIERGEGRRLTVLALGDLARALGLEASELLIETYRR